LHQVSFAALWNGEEGTYLGQEHILSIVPSASSLVFFAGTDIAPFDRVLALGDPEGNLPRALADARAVADLLAGEALLGLAASEARLRRELAAGLGILHVAAHGEWDAADPEHSRIRLAPGEGEDGSLEVREIITELDLRGLRLVVLSACETGSAEGDAGDERVGLARAFLAAGSRTVVATAWKVDDASASFLTRAFYRHLHSGKPAAEALALAQEETRHQPGWSAPYHWAAFSLHGDGQITWPPSRLKLANDNKLAEGNEQSKGATQ
jgi:CHAT domain-containing protein